MTSPAARPGHDLTDTHDRESIVHGYTIALWWAAGILLLAGTIAATLPTAKTPKHALARQ